MNEDDKYYVPDIEDFRIGYEYEKSNDENKSEWRVEIKDWDFEGLDFYLREGMIRVPYLSQEQIENEGWIEVILSGDFIDGSNLKVDMIRMKKNTEYEPLLLTYNLKTKMMEIGNVRDILFSGECKDINTFRWICKLLKI